MVEHGHPAKQAVAAALHTAHPQGGKAKDAETAMTASEVNKKNESYWGNLGPAPREEAAPMLAGTRVGPASIKTWHGAGVGDEVQPTQSSPPDSRSDNLTSREHGGIPGTEPLTSGAMPSAIAEDAENDSTPEERLARKSQKGVNLRAVSRYAESYQKKHEPSSAGQPGSGKVNKAINTNIGAHFRKQGPGDESFEKWAEEEKEESEHKKAKDDLVEGSEAMEIGEHQTDAIGIGEAVAKGRNIGNKIAEGSTGLS
jgi:hypothetical protein